MPVLYNAEYTIPLTVNVSSSVACRIVTHELWFSGNTGDVRMFCNSF
ncbi:hypothetical protein [Methanoplanus endosymbiosus]|uniref:Uncharacterized protein n=1 Tax=Methanoplanus endosymbiosus TaxID=33865 RepID=A0A9E7PR87_9EURY|nr:hypothetical protein [Methanoplanus endosymbiosus]UUX93564.1 hypothetical protein L6E24_05460 [Methanoplanus endosymbiosus]